MEKPDQIVDVFIQTPNILERWSARLKTECECGTVLVTTLELSQSGIVSTSVSTVCPDCHTDHHRLIAPVAGMLDAAKEQNERLAILN